MVVNVQNRRIKRLLITIPANAPTLPEEVADLLWQVYRVIQKTEEGSGS